MLEFNKIEVQSKIDDIFVDEYYDKYVVDFFVNSKILPEYSNYVLSNPYEIKDKVHVKLLKDFNYTYYRTGPYAGNKEANIKVYKEHKSDSLIYYIKYRIITEGTHQKMVHIYYNIELEFIKSRCIIKMRKESGQSNDFSLASAIADYLIKNKLAKNIKFRTFDGYEENKVLTFCIYDKNVDVIKNVKFLDDETEIFIVPNKDKIPDKLISKLKAKNIIFYYM